MAAAHGLLRHEHPEALKAMIGEWRKSASPRKNGDDQGDGSGPYALVPLLAGSGSPAAIHALAEGLRE